MAKYTKKEIELLKAIANLRGLAYELAASWRGPVGAYDSPQAALSKATYGAGLPHHEDLHAVTPVRAALSQEFDRGYRRGVRDATFAMTVNVREISNWEVPLLAHEDEEGF